MRVRSGCRSQTRPSIQVGTDIRDGACAAVKLSTSDHGRQRRDRVATVRLIDAEKGPGGDPLSVLKHLFEAAEVESHPLSILVVGDFPVE
jgi:hypothetical protein